MYNKDTTKRYIKIGNVTLKKGKKKETKKIRTSKREKKGTEKKKEKVRLLHASGRGPLRAFSQKYRMSPEYKASR